MKEQDFQYYFTVNAAVAVYYGEQLETLSKEIYNSTEYLTYMSLKETLLISGEVMSHNPIDLGQKDLKVIEPEDEMEDDILNPDEIIICPLGDIVNFTQYRLPVYPSEEDKDLDHLDFDNWHKISLGQGFLFVLAGAGIGILAFAGLLCLTAA